MSVFREWIEKNLFADPNGQVLLSDLFALFKRSLPSDQQGAWPKARVEQELGASVVLVGRRDQPKKMVSGWSFTAPPANSRTTRNIVNAVDQLTVTPFLVQHINYVDAVVLTRPDYLTNPEAYRLAYQEIADTLKETGLHVDTRMVQAAFISRRDDWLRITKDPSFALNDDEREDCHLKAATIKDDGILNRRWRRDGDERENLPGWIPDCLNNEELVVVGSYYATHQPQ